MTTQVSRARRIVLGSEVFTTQTAARQRIRAMLHGAELGKPLQGADDALCRALLERHRHVVQKTGPGVRHFEVRMSDYHERCFWLVRVDGSETDWSYNECLRRSGPREDGLVALRNAIGDQVRAFRAAVYADAALVLCAVTGELVAESDCHVDHASPTFVELAEAFAEHVGGWDRLRVTENIDGLIGTEMTDDHQRRKWQAFHRRCARLRVVTRAANVGLLRRKHA